MPQAETHAISSDLSGPAAEQVMRLWEQWRERFGLEAARCAKNPHLTYVVGEAPCDALASGLEGLAARLPAFDIAIDGVHVFDRETPVVYLGVRADETLRSVHREVTRIAREADMRLWPYYAQDVWVPHVTLALHDVDRGQLGSLLVDAAEVAWHPGSVLDTLALVRLGPLVGTRREHTYQHVWSLGGGR